MVLGSAYDGRDFFLRHPFLDVLPSSGESSLPPYRLNEAERGRERHKQRSGNRQPPRKRLLLFGHPAILAAGQAQGNGPGVLTQRAGPVAHDESVSSPLNCKRRALTTFSPELKLSGEPRSNDQTAAVSRVAVHGRSVT